MERFYKSKRTGKLYTLESMTGYSVRLRSLSNNAHYFDVTEFREMEEVTDKAIALLRTLEEIPNERS